MRKKNAPAITAFGKKLTSHELKGIKGGDIVPCLDLNINCAQWAANGFCTSNFYTLAVRLTCARTCNLCEV